MQSRTLTVAEVAERFGVTPETVAGWIRAGELRAVNVSRSRTSKKPRWRVTPEALAAFETARSATAEQPAAPKRRKRPAGDVIEFYT
ncbi:MAG TPA: helix-turn-helix domain-containing protein [Gemmata sp.]